MNELKNKTIYMRNVLDGLKKLIPNKQEKEIIAKDSSCAGVFDKMFKKINPKCKFSLKSISP